jgi:hypothetical protein
MYSASEEKIKQTAIFIWKNWEIEKKDRNTFCARKFSTYSLMLFWFVKRLTSVIENITKVILQEMLA